MLIDTVGLVRRLPHNLVEAFKSTLEEAASADVLLCVCDASSPEMDEQIEVTTSLLAELGAADTPMIKELNKCDLVPGLRPLDRKDTVLISAREKTGFEELLAAIMAALEPSQKRLKLLLPYTAAGLLAEIRRRARSFRRSTPPTAFWPMPWCISGCCTRWPPIRSPDPMDTEKAYGTIPYALFIAVFRFIPAGSPC